MKLNTISILILLISSFLLSCSTLQRYSISRTESFNRHFGCDSVVVTLTDSSKQQLRTNSIEFTNNALLFAGNNSITTINLSLIQRVDTKRKQSYKGDIWGIGIGAAIGFGLRNFVPATDSTRLFRDIYASALWAVVGWYIGRELRTEYQITVGDSLVLSPPSSMVYTEYIGRYNLMNFYYEPLLSYDSSALWGLGLRSAVQTGFGMTVPLFGGFRFDIPLIPLIVIGKEYGFEIGAGVDLQYWALKTEEFYRSDSKLTTKFIKLAGHFGYRYCSFSSNTEIFRITVTPTLEANSQIAWIAGISFIL